MAWPAWTPATPEKSPYYAVTEHTGIEPSSRLREPGAEAKPLTEIQPGCSKPSTSC